MHIQLLLLFIIIYHHLNLSWRHIIGWFLQRGSASEIIEGHRKIALIRWVLVLKFLLFVPVSGRGVSCLTMLKFGIVGVEKCFRCTVVLLVLIIMWGSLVALVGLDQWGADSQSVFLRIICISIIYVFVSIVRTLRPLHLNIVWRALSAR